MMIGSGKTLNRRRGDMQNMMNVTLMMIILAFFIVLNSMAVIQEDKKRKALGSLTGTLGVLTGGLSPMQFKGKDFSIKPGPMSQEHVVMPVRLSSFERYVMAKGVGADVLSIITKGGLELSLESDLLFNPGSADFSENGEKMIAKINEFMKDIKGSLVIEGHTSDRKVASVRYPSLVDLSIARAGAVGRMLLRDGGLKKAGIAIAGYGDKRPREPNDTAKNRKKNDRIRIVYKYAI